jgi:low affinity Fe/Cu permease
LLVFLWALSGPFFNFSDTWQLVINTSTTVITFLMVFLIQNTQNRETHAMNLKLDELALAVRAAKNSVVAIEEKDDQALERIEQEHNERVKSTIEIT